MVAQPFGTGIARERALVPLAQGGDADAFDALIGPRIDRSFRTAVAILGNEADARDAVQEASLSAWRELPRLRDVDRFDAWLGRILVNACRHVRRTSKRRAVHEIPAASFGDTLPDPVDPYRPTIGDDAAQLDALERAFDRLTVDHRAVLVLHHLRGRSLDDIAAELAVPLGTVKSRHHAARRALVAAMEAEGR